MFNELIQFVTTHPAEFVCLGSAAVFMGGISFGFIKMMEPIDRRIASMERYLKEAKEDEEAYARASAAGVVLDPKEQRTGKAAKPINQPSSKKEKPKELE
ncbi:MAG: hypothetical protein Q8L51_02230 [Candidatus Amesbacteria bacterium]|nr:hypothetical protein [Candidatus Amesbacteria bacterium]